MYYGARHIHWVAHYLSNVCNTLSLSLSRRAVMLVLLYIHRMFNFMYNLSDYLYPAVRWCLFYHIRWTAILLWSLTCLVSDIVMMVVLFYTQGGSHPIGNSSSLKTCCDACSVRYIRCDACSVIYIRCFFLFLVRKRNLSYLAFHSLEFDCYLMKVNSKTRHEH